MLLLGVGCAADSTPAEDTADVPFDSSAAERFETQEEFDAAQGTEDLGFFAGCSNAEIRRTQAACRDPFFCGPGNSRGVHFCDRQPSRLDFQCDCISGTDWFGSIFL